MKCLTQVLRILPQNQLKIFFEEFADNFGIEYGITKDGKTFYTGKSTIAVNDTDPQFAQALQNTY